MVARIAEQDVWKLRQRRKSSRFLAKQRFSLSLQQQRLYKLFLFLGVVERLLTQLHGLLEVFDIPQIQFGGTEHRLSLIHI